jgi:hypothetical protein
MNLKANSVADKTNKRKGIQGMNGINANLFKTKSIEIKGITVLHVMRKFSIDRHRQAPYFKKQESEELRA